MHSFPVPHIHSALQRVASEESQPGVEEVIIYNITREGVGGQRCGVCGGDGDKGGGMVRAKGEVKREGGGTKEVSRGSSDINENEVKGGGFVAIGAMPGGDARGVEAEKVFACKPGLEGGGPREGQTLSGDQLWEWY